MPDLKYFSMPGSLAFSPHCLRTACTEIFLDLAYSLIKMGVLVLVLITANLPRCQIATKSKPKFIFYI